MDNVNTQTLGPERKLGKGIKPGPELLGPPRHPARLAFILKRTKGEGETFEVEGEQLDLITSPPEGESWVIRTNSGMSLISNHESQAPAVFSESYLQEALRAASGVGTQVVSLRTLPEPVVQETGFRLALTVFSHDEEDKISCQTVFGPSDIFPAPVVEALLAGWRPKIDRFNIGLAGAEEIMDDVFENMISGLALHLSFEERSVLLEPMLDLWRGLGFSQSDWSWQWTECLTAPTASDLSLSEPGVLEYQQDGRQPEIAGVIILSSLGQEVKRAA